MGAQLPPRFQRSDHTTLARPLFLTESWIREWELFRSDSILNSGKEQVYSYSD